jgi:flagellar protein FlgJ
MMDIASAQISSANDFQGLAKLRAQAQKDQSVAIDQSAKQFEGMFLSMMLKEMRKTVPESELFNSNSMKLYQDMYDQQMALEMAKEGPLGLATMLKNNLNGGMSSASTELGQQGYALKPEVKSFALNPAIKTIPIQNSERAAIALQKYQAMQLKR